MSEFDAPEPTAEQDEETRRAIRLVGRVVAVAFCLYALVGGVVSFDETLVWYGRSEINEDGFGRGGRQMHFVTSRAWSLDRSEDAPRLFLLGSSMVREAFDTDLIQRELDLRGAPWSVEKLAFERGAPVFAWAMAEQMDLRRGDRVVLGVHYDHFRNDWLGHHGGVPAYMNHILRPRHLNQIASLGLADRLEYGLASSPPAAFHRKREPFRDGFQQWLDWTVRLWSDEPPPQVTPPKRFNEREVVANFRQLARSQKLEMAPEELRLEEGQINLDAIRALEDVCAERGAELWVVFMTPAPEYYERFERGLFSETFHERAGERWSNYARLSPMTQSFYADYKHVNLRGRPIVSRQLVQLMVGPRVPDAPSVEGAK